MTIKTKSKAIDGEPYSRIIEKLEQSNKLMEESILLVETRITQVEDRLVEFKRQDVARKAAEKIEDPRVIGKSEVHYHNRIQHQNKRRKHAANKPEGANQDPKVKIRRAQPCITKRSNFEFGAKTIWNGRCYFTKSNQVRFVRNRSTKSKTKDNHETKQHANCRA